MTDLFERERDADFFRERGFGLRIGFGKKPALLVVDVVKAFTDPQRMLGAEMGPQIVATNQLLDVAHDKNLPVVFSTVAYEDSNFKDAGVWALKQKGVATLVAGSDGPELDPRLHYQKGDAILYKKYASCFFGTDLIPRLLAFGVDTLIIDRLHHQRLRARERCRFMPERLSPDGGARSGRRSLAACPRPEPVRSRRQVCRRCLRRRNGGLSPRAVTFLFTLKSGAIAAARTAVVMSKRSSPTCKQNR